MVARIIIDVERSGGGYKATLVGTGVAAYGARADCAANALVAALFEMSLYPQWYSQPDRDIAARIMAEIEGEQ